MKEEANLFIDSGLEEAEWNVTTQKKIPSVEAGLRTGLRTRLQLSA